MTQITVDPIRWSAWTANCREQGEDRTLQEQGYPRLVPVSGL